MSTATYPQTAIPGITPRILLRCSKYLKSEVNEGEGKEKVLPFEDIVYAAPAVHNSQQFVPLHCSTEVLRIQT